VRISCGRDLVGVKYRFYSKERYHENVSSRLDARGCSYHVLLPGYAQRAVFLVRHADRLDGSEDTALSKAGEARAQLLARLLKEAGITAIYTSHFQRTIKTAEPLATSLHITPISIPADDREGLFKRIRTKNRDDIVLIVGHDSTVPALLKMFGHPADITIAPTEYDNLFVVVPKDGGPPTQLRLRY
jgi:broad specificity phosphatase PhoE